MIKPNDDLVYRQGYGKKVFDLLNEAYAPLFGFSKLSDEQIDFFLHKYLSIIDKQLIPIVVDEKNEVVGVAITMGSLSQSMRKAKGRLFPMGWYHLLKALRWKPEDNAEMLLIAVKPELQGLGINALFFDNLIPVYIAVETTEARVGEAPQVLQERNKIIKRERNWNNKNNKI